MFAIVEEPLDVGALVQDAQRPDCGAVATFVGTTRIDESGGAAVEYLEYEAYRPMADRKLEEIGAEIETLGRQARLDSASSGQGRPRRGQRRHSRRRSAPRAGVRGEPLRHRADKGGRAHLEARGLVGWVRVGGEPGRNQGSGFRFTFRGIDSTASRVPWRMLG